MEETVIDQDGNQPSEAAKTRAIVAHITLIGTIIAIVQNNPKDEFASYYIRQMLGLSILMMTAYVVSMIIPFLWIIFLLAQLGVLALWILSLISAVNGEKKETPIVGAMFQDWFKTL